ncbi:MAG: hypothetical protein ACPGLY_26485 [Rubripirellula sp.]
MNTNNAQLELVRRCLDGEATHEEFKQFEEILRNDPEFRKDYLRYLNVDLALAAMPKETKQPGKSSSTEELEPLGNLLRTNAEARATLRSLATIDAGCQQLAADEAVAISSDRVSNAGLHGRAKPMWLTWGSVAACFAVTLIFVWSYRSSTANASSVLHQARLAATERVDRSYQVTMTKLVAGNDQPNVTEVELNMRGGGRFVVQPQNKRYVMGNDGTDFWLILKEGPVLVTGDILSLPREQMRKLRNLPVVQLDSDPNELLLLELVSILELIEKNYNVELLESEDPGLRHVLARRRDGRRLGPLTIDLWVDVYTGVTRRMALELVPFSDKVLAKRVSIIQIESRVFSESWYGHAEHAPGREVSRMGANSKKKKNNATRESLP